MSLCRDGVEMQSQLLQNKDLLLTPQFPKLHPSLAQTAAGREEAGMSLHVLIKDLTLLLIHPSPFTPLLHLNSSQHHWLCLWYSNIKPKNSLLKTACWGSEGNVSFWKAQSSPSHAGLLPSGSACSREQLCHHLQSKCFNADITEGE